jgi:hypothetical protein
LRYTCSRCKKEYKRLPRGLISYRDVTILLCRFCVKVPRVDTDDRLFFPSAIVKHVAHLLYLDEPHISSNLLHYGYITYQDTGYPTRIYRELIERR